MEETPESRTLVLHTERITISNDRYLIYYTFTSPGDGEDAEASEENERD